MESPGLPHTSGPLDAFRGPDSVSAPVLAHVAPATPPTFLPQPVSWPQPGPLDLLPPASTQSPSLALSPCVRGPCLPLCIAPLFPLQGSSGSVDRAPSAAAAPTGGRARCSPGPVCWEQEGREPGHLRAIPLSTHPPEPRGCIQHQRVRQRRRSRERGPRRWGHKWTGGGATGG